ncbi:MAG: hypothetical protein ACRDFX_11600 [Chloroflexota bacterium]
MQTASAAEEEDLSHRVGSRLDGVRKAPHMHVPRLVLSKEHRHQGIFTHVAEWVNAFVGSMWVFVFVTLAIVVWLFAGNVVGFDKTPWPLLLTILNLPQLSIMISLQVSANLAQHTGDARAIADHETLIALHELSKQQLQILESQNTILDLLKTHAGIEGGPTAG